MSTYELVYFNGRGLAEVSRLLFQAAGQQFVDTRIEMADWPKFKPGNYIQLLHSQSDFNHHN